MSKKVTSGAFSLSKIKEGVVEFANIVKITLGPKGRTVISHRGFGAPHITKDGATIAGDIEFDDPVKEMAGKITRQVSKETVDFAGDGSTTSTILIGAIVSLGYKILVKSYSLPYFGEIYRRFTKVNPHKFKQGLDLACSEVVEELKKNKIELTDVEEIRDIATISCNNDPKMGNLLYKVYNELGMDAKIIRSPDPSTTGDDHVEISKGYVISQGFYNPSFTNDKDKKACELTNPIFALFPKFLSDFNDVLPFLEFSFFSKRPLVVIADGFDDTVMEMLVQNCLMPKSSHILAIKTPGMGSGKDSEMQDLSAILNYDLRNTSDAEKIKNNALGNCLSLTCTEFETAFTFSDDSNSVLDSHLESLKRSKGDLSGPALEKLGGRISKLEGKIGVIYLYSKTPSDKLERIDRLDDAICATRAAVEEGYVAGGGIPLLRASSILSINLSRGVGSKNLDGDVLLGYECLLEAIREPFNTLITNSGASPKTIAKKIDEEIHSLPDSYVVGYNPLSEQVEDLIISGIIDPVKVPCLALENAVSASGSLLTTGCTITLN